MFFLKKIKEIIACHTVISYKEIKETKILSTGKIFISIVGRSTKSKVGNCFVCTENQLHLLETTTDFSAKTDYEGVNLEYVKDKYAQILSIFVSHLS